MDSLFTIDEKVKLDPFKYVHKIEKFWSNEKCGNVNLNFEMRNDRRDIICHSYFYSLFILRKKIKSHILNVVAFCLDYSFKKNCQGALAEPLQQTR